MKRRSVGIGDIACYIPTPFVDIETVVKRRSEQYPQLARRFRRALEATGQVGIRFPHRWEDTVTLSAQAADALMRRQSNRFDPNCLRYLVVGTETPIDHSKPVAAYVEGILQRGGFDISERIATFQVQHACASGTLAMMSVGSLLLAGGEGRASGMVICSDIARYETPSTAEITQGAGAIALLIENNPRLIELDLGTQGYASRDVDDFFRPLGSATARVKGGYSVKCYHEALETAFLDYCSNLGMPPAETIHQIDLFALHVPFRKMALKALRNLLAKFGDIPGGDLEGFMSERGFQESLQVAAEVGNIYSGSLYLVLMSLLSERYAALGDSIVGRRLLLCSYGSGNTMIVLGGRIAEGAPEIIERWDLGREVAITRQGAFEDYQRWVASPDTPDIVDAASIPPRSIYLSGIRADGYREYRYR